MRIANVALGGTKEHGPYAPRLLNWLRASGDNRPDIVTLQKVGPSKCFPTEELGDLGYESWSLWKRDGSDLGVAVLSRRRRSLPEPKVFCCELPGAGRPESRFLTVDIGGLWVSSVYAPYGPMKPDKQEAISRRVAWLNRLRKHVGHKGYANRAALLCGDFNVKLDDQELGTTGPYTCYEQKALQALLNPDVGFVDLYRQQHPDFNELGHTRGYDKKPQGHSRLHLILASGSLAWRVQDVHLDRRGNWPRPDAPPLIVDFEDIGA